ncbi:MAG: pentapeptide repeat-containing protein [Geminicoccaceae bacterium]
MIGGAVLAAVTTIDIGPALAGCSDVPAPEVNWRRCQLDGDSFPGIDVSRGMLRDASFKRSDLTGAILDGIEAQRAKFVSAVANEASFEDANLVMADFTSAELNGASFRGANLLRARFFRADLRNADLTGAQLRETDFLKAQLEGARWIDGKTICAEGSVGRCLPEAQTKDKAAALPVLETGALSGP